MSSTCQEYSRSYISICSSILLLYQPLIFLTRILLLYYIFRCRQSPAFYVASVCAVIFVFSVKYIVFTVVTAAFQKPRLFPENASINITYVLQNAVARGPPMNLPRLLFRSLRQWTREWSPSPLPHPMQLYKARPQVTLHRSQPPTLR